MNDADTKRAEANSQPPIYNPEPPKESKKSKRINRIVVAALIIVAIALGIMFFWATASEKPITLNKEPFPTRTIRERPTAGGVVFLTADYCKNTSVVGELRISFESARNEIFLPLTKDSSQKGCHNNQLLILIPYDIEPDTYKIKLRLTYDLNPLKQDVTQMFYSYPVVIDATSATNQLPINSSLDLESLPPASLQN